jgi:hypothetical protein
MLSLFCLLQVANATLWMTFSPISDLAQNYFGGPYSTNGSKTSINMLANIFLILYTPGSFVGFITMKVKGPRTTMILA